ncbi:spermidine synthase [uncultured Thiohalocapsa sp.]|uniref:spermidine synthase n=1 Tax=uncultured Thiohalocapsa sp. TaxID=768990 RepID=UPI0025DD7441|nr:spermidine synthase [uncultured Thiohalocapsa sp.]
MLSKERFTAIVTTLFLWSLAGALFGGLYIGLYEVLQVLGLGPAQAVVVAALAAAMTTAAFYSAMPVALMGAMAGVLASIGYLIVGGPRLELGIIALVAAGLGLLGGAFFAWTSHAGARPLAETLTGLLAGLGAGAILVLVLTLYRQPVGAFVMAAGIVALVGSLFQLNEHWIVKHVHGWLPTTLAAPLVAALVAAVVGASIWMVAGTTAAALAPEAKTAVQRVLAEVPAGFLGGLLGGAVTGLLLEVLGFRLEEHGTV